MSEGGGKIGGDGRAAREAVAERSGADAGPAWDLSRWRHSHAFGQGRRRTGEARMAWVLALSVAMMIAEIAAALATGSMALLSDGLHMASHAAALGIGVLAYVYARRHAEDPRFAFGTGKIDSLAGLASALILALFAVWMAWECLERLFRPAAIDTGPAMGIAVLGLAVNGAALLLLKEPHGCRGHGHGPCGHGPDHNLRAARLHLLADALTSFLAILALAMVEATGISRLDPLAGLAGAVLIVHWAWRLMADTSRVLLDHQAPPALREAVREAMESAPGTRLVDLHVWSLGHDSLGGIVSLVSRIPRSPAYYKALLPAENRIAHLTVEVNPDADVP